MLEEWDQGRGHRDDLLGRHVHVFDLVGPRLGELVAVARRDAVGQEVPGRVERRVGLGDDVLLFLVGRQVLDLGGHDGPDREGLGLLLLQLGDGRLVDALPGLEDDLPSLATRSTPASNGGRGRIVPGHRPLDLAVRRLDEAVAVDPAVGGQRADQADVRAFRRLDRADPAVVAVVDVADVEAGALTGQAARAKGRQAALAGQLGQRVGLVHELGELAAAEELLHGGHDRPDVDQGVGRGLVDLLDRHPLADDALHAEQADPERVLDQLAVGPDAAVAEVVDVVGERCSEGAVRC
jgi:hypothetical protein